MWFGLLDILIVCFWVLFWTIYQSVDQYLENLDPHSYHPDPQVRWLYRPLPTIGITDKEAKKFARLIARDLDGTGPNRAITGYLLDRHDWKEMERRLDVRLGIEKREQEVAPEVAVGHAVSTGLATPAPCHICGKNHVSK